MKDYPKCPETPVTCTPGGTRRRVSINEIHIQMLQFVESKPVNRLSLSVNDSAAGKAFKDVYDMEEVIGEGGFAMVYRCVHKENKHTYAVKEVFESEYLTAGENVLEEIDSLKRLRDGPFVVKLLDIFREVDCTYMVMEELVGGDLLAHIDDIGKFDERDARKISRTLLEAIAFCHKKNIVHRDIKPDNILFVSAEKTDMTIKLADFGCAHPITGPNCLRTLCGTPQYVAPELYTHEDGYDERCDLWSAGVVMFILLSGECPFEGEEHELPTLITEGFYEFERKHWQGISDPPKELVSSLLVVDVTERASLKDALNSKWLKRRDKDLLELNQLDMNDSCTSFDLWLKRSNRSLVQES